MFPDQEVGRQKQQIRTVFCTFFEDFYLISDLLWKAEISTEIGEGIFTKRCCSDESLMRKGDELVIPSGVSCCPRCLIQI